MTSNPDTRSIEAPEDDLVLVDDHGAYAVITINRPEKRNAMSRAAQRHFRAALDKVHEKKAVVLTGTGRSFCAGVDLREVPDDLPTRRRTSQALHSWSLCQAELRAHPAVFIAAVNGYALGGGSTLINNCELAVAAESAEIGTPEIGFGVWPAMAGPAMIRRLLPKHAAQVIFTATRIDANTAFRMGLVNEVVPDDQLLDRACQLAAHIASFDATVLDWSKKAFHHMQALDWDDAMDYSVYTAAAIARQQAGASVSTEVSAADGRTAGRSE